MPRGIVDQACGLAEMLEGGGQIDATFSNAELPEHLSAISRFGRLRQCAPQVRDGGICSPARQRSASGIAQNLWHERVAGRRGAATMGGALLRVSSGFGR